MGASAIYGLPWPELPSQADGPAAFQALANELDSTLAGLVQPFTNVLSDFTMNGFGAVHDVGLSAVPLGRVSLLIVTFNCRITSTTGQFGAFQIYDGATLVTGTPAVQLGATPGGSIVAPVCMAVARSFVNQPVFRATSGGAAATVSIDNLRATGVGFGWPS